jgi:cbb3-type cytochrome oxidase cytochrome c subunit
MKKVTNLSKATEIVKTSIDARTPKSEILAKLVEELGVTRSNAFVYFPKATKALDISISVDKGATKDEVKAASFFAKAEAKMAKKSITELTATKRKSKVAEIDAVIDGLRKTGAAVSPFAALGV